MCHTIEIPNYDTKTVFDRGCFSIPFYIIKFNKLRNSLNILGAPSLRHKSRLFFENSSC